MFAHVPCRRRLIVRNFHAWEPAFSSPTAGRTLRKPGFFKEKLITIIQSYMSNCPLVLVLDPKHSSHSVLSVLWFGQRVCVVYNNQAGTLSSLLNVNLLTISIQFSTCYSSINFQNKCSNWFFYLFFYFLFLWRLLTCLFGNRILKIICVKRVKLPMQMHTSKDAMKGKFVCHITFKPPVSVCQTKSFRSSRSYKQIKLTKLKKGFVRHTETNPNPKDCIVWFSKKVEMFFVFFTGLYLRIIKLVW